VLRVIFGPKEEITKDYGISHNELKKKIYFSPDIMV
jgi:hypothetical protein